LVEQWIENPRVSGSTPLLNKMFFLSPLEQFQVLPLGLGFTNEFAILSLILLINTVILFLGKTPAYCCADPAAAGVLFLNSVLLPLNPQIFLTFYAAIICCDLLFAEKSKDCELKPLLCNESEIFQPERLPEVVSNVDYSSILSGLGFFVLSIGIWYFFTSFGKGGNNNSSFEELAGKSVTPRVGLSNFEVEKNRLFQIKYNSNLPLIPFKGETINMQINAKNLKILNGLVHEGCTHQNPVVD
jgi:hypothetical protein